MLDSRVSAMVARQVGERFRSCWAAGDTVYPLW
jgi:hypothetical protein